MTLTNVILSTRNQSKANQIRPIFQDLPVNLLTLEEAGIKGEAVENGKTLEENALKKAFFAWELTGSWSMADDTGILIDALDGRPGVNSARWAGESTTTEEIMRYTLKQLEGVPLEKRTATFKTVAAVISPEGDHLFFIGRVRGHILTEPRCTCQPRMPYGPIFVPDGYEKSLVELSVQESEEVSHRGQAFRQVREFFERHFSKKAAR